MSNRNKMVTALIAGRIKKKDPEAEVILFGSRARSQETKGSDWDILILLNQASVSRKLEKEYRDELFDVELEIGEPISTFVFAKADWESRHKITPLYQNIKKEGIYL